MTRTRLRALRGALALGLVVGVAGCWFQPDADAGHTRSNPFESTLTAATVGGLTQRWTTPFETVASAPVVSGDRAYVTHRDETGVTGAYRLTALRTGDGAVDWDRGSGSVPPEPNEYADGPTFVGDDVWVANRFNYDPDCPLPFWRVSADGRHASDGEPTSFLSTPVAAGGTVAYAEFVFGDPPACEPVGARLTVRDSETFALRYTLDGGPYPTDSPTAPAIAGDTLVVGMDDELLALPAGGCGAATCEPRWAVSVASGTPGVDSRVDSPPVVADGRVFASVVSTDGTGTTTTAVRAYDLDDGAALWSWPAPFVTGLAVAGDTVFAVASTEDGTASRASLVALPAACGPCAGQWQVPIGDGTGAGHPVGAPVVGGDVVYVPTNAPRLGGVDGQVLAFDADGCGPSPCAPLATVGVPGTPGGMAVSGGQVIVSSAVDGRTGHGGAVTALGLP